jgi:peptidoglycan/LPS O-acetylase OafA/YrhL
MVYGMTRNHYEDWVRIILSLLVITIHLCPGAVFIGFTGECHYLMSNGIARIAVPTFFILTGFHMPETVSRQKIIDKIKRAGILFIVWQLIYLIFIVYDFYGNPTKLILAIVHGYMHLWYLSALVIGLIIFYLFVRFLHENICILLLIAITIYLFGYCIQLAFSTGMLDNEPSIKTIYRAIGTSRNGIFFCFPLVTFGYIIRKKIEIINGKEITLIVIGILALLLESNFYKGFVNSDMDLFVGIFPLIIGLIGLIEKNKKANIHPVNPSIAIGIYLIHPFIIDSVEILKWHIDIHINYICMYLFVVIASLIGWFVVDKVNKKIKILL